MRAPRRFLGMVGFVVGGLVACGTPQEPEPSQEVFSEVVAEVPPASPEAKRCSLPPPGSTPTEALEAITPAIRVQCRTFPGICMPEGHRRQFQRPPTACWLHEPFGGRSQYTVEYDAKGRLRSFEGPRQGESYRYDDCGRIVDKGFNPGGLVSNDSSWEYGPDGRVLQYTVARGLITYVTHYTYGDSGRLLQAETTTVYSTDTRVVSARFHYFHDEQGRIVRAEHEVNLDDSARRQVAAIEERSYAPSGALVELRTTNLLNGSNSLKAFSEGRRSRELESNHLGSRETVWTYWPDGLVQTEWSHSRSEQGDSTVETRFEYDDASRLDSVTTTSVRRAPDGTETPSESVERYIYDANGDLRMKRSVNRSTGEASERAYEGNCY